VVFGGVSQKPQEEVLQRGVDILIATPGRLNDLIGQRVIDLQHVKILILDEADRMLDMGFINDVKKIIAKTPVKKQTLLFSATMPPDIATLSSTILVNPTRIDIAPVSSTVDMIEQYLYYVDKGNKKDLLVHLLKDESIVSALVFTRTKHGADRVVKLLAKDNITAQAIHGDKSQGARQLALNNFKKKTLRVLIATDIAARGIDIDELSHVINYDLPNIPETYVHRIGRTGRAGLEGVAISFCDFDEKEYLADIEKLIRKHITEVKDHPYPLMNNFPSEKTTQPRREPSRKAATQPAAPKRTYTQVEGSSIENSSKTNHSQKNSRYEAGSRKNSTRAGSAQTETLKQTSTSRNSAQSNSSRPASTSRYSSQTESSKPSSTPRYSSQTSTSKSSSSSTSSTQVDNSKKKKLRMTADGQLKEKKTKIWFPNFRGKS
jgi:ATP-dependent RNA helicase RhlE